MALETFINQLAASLLLPPGINFLLFILGYISLRYSKKLAISLFVSSIVSLYLLSLPIISNKLNQSLYTEQALTQQQVKNYAKQQRNDLAIVVLSGGRIDLAPEYGNIDIVSEKTLQRILYGAWLHKKTLLPILVSGGSVFGEATPEAVLMNQTMLSAFNIAPKWIESKSGNTAENARFSAQRLKNNHISEILLVTHANHMQRAKTAFERQGIKVIAAPTVIKSTRTRWRDFFPSAKALYRSQLALHEKIGSFWYSIRY